MTHFSALVFLPAEKVHSQTIRDLIGQAIEPWSENRKVPSYLVTCACRGIPAAEDVDQRLGTERRLASTRAHIERELAQVAHEDRVGVAEGLWSKLAKPLLAQRTKEIEGHPLRDTPKPDCPRCQGTGAQPTNYNQDAKWDWWEIGGRFDHYLLIPPMAQQETDPALPWGGTKYWGKPFDGNIVEVRELGRAAFSTFAVIYPESETTWRWLGRIKSPVWSYPYDQEENYTRDVAEAVKACPKHLAVLLDMHI